VRARERELDFFVPSPWLPLRGRGRQGLLYFPSPCVSTALFFYVRFFSVCPLSPSFFLTKETYHQTKSVFLTGGKREKRERGERERKERERVFWVFWFLLLFFFYFSSFFRLFYIQEEMASFSPLLTGVGRERGFGEVERVVEEGRGQRERENEKRRQRFSSPSSTSS
jgi:4-amino-4-deoxy-L-arabinose transferase-like glycosyltransferase